MKIEKTLFGRMLVFAAGLPVLLCADLAALCKDTGADQLRKIVQSHTLDITHEKRIDINHDGIRERVRLHPNMGSRVRLDEIEIHTMKGARVPYEAYEPAAFTATRDVIAYEGRYYVAHYDDPDKKILHYVTYLDPQMHERALCVLDPDKKKRTDVESQDMLTVFDKKISLDAHTPAVLQLREEKTDHTLAQIPAEILIRYDINGTTRQYRFVDNAGKFPVFYFNTPTLHTDIDKRVNLVNRVNVFDADDDGNNEIFVYGTSSYGGSGMVGKVFVFHKNAQGEIEKIGEVEARDNFEIEYIQKENIIVVAQFIWGEGEGHYGDRHYYQIDAYALGDHLKRIPLMKTQKRYLDFNRTVIEDNIDTILNVYRKSQKHHTKKY